MVYLDPLAPELLPELRSLPGASSSLEAAYALEAAIAGNLNCRAWVDAAVAPALAYLWDGAYLHYVLGARTAAAERAVSGLLLDQLVPTARASGVQGCKLHLAHSSWANWLPALAGAQRYERASYMLALAPFGAPPALTLAPDYRLAAIDAPLLADALLDTAAARAEIASCWPSVERFHQHGWGYGVLHQDKLVAWCTAELVSPGRCGVGIETIEAHQRRGLGTAMAAAFAQRCRRDGVRALWDAWAANLPSRRTAERAGWALAETYTVVFAPLAALSD